jgi:hypothetical protein
MRDVKGPLFFSRLRLSRLSPARSTPPRSAKITLPRRCGPRANRLNKRCFAAQNPSFVGIEDGNRRTLEYRALAQKIDPTSTSKAPSQSRMISIR